MQPFPGEGVEEIKPLGPTAYSSSFPLLLYLAEFIHFLP